MIRCEPLLIEVNLTSNRHVCLAEEDQLCTRLFAVLTTVL